MRCFPLRAQNRGEISDRQSRLQKQPLLHILVHAHGRTQHARAYVREPRQIEQSLHGAVFAVGAVKDGKHHIHLQRG